MNLSLPTLLPFGDIDYWNHPSICSLLMRFSRLMTFCLLPFTFAFHFPFASSMLCCCFVFFVSCIVCCVQIAFGRQFRIRLERHLGSLITYAGQVNLVKMSLSVVRLLSLSLSPCLL